MSDQHLNSQILEGLARAKDAIGASQNMKDSPMMRPNVGGTGISSILKAMDQRYLGQYIAKLEQAKAFLNGYIEELDALDKRLEKAGKTGLIRKAMGGNDIDARKDSIEETIDRLDAHQRATLKRIGVE